MSPQNPLRPTLCRPTENPGDLLLPGLVDPAPLTAAVATKGSHKTALAELQKPTGKEGPSKAAAAASAAPLSKVPAPIGASPKSPIVEEELTVGGDTAAEKAATGVLAGVAQAVRRAVDAPPVAQSSRSSKPACVPVEDPVAVAVKGKKPVVRKDPNVAGGEGLWSWLFDGSAWLWGTLGSQSVAIVWFLSPYFLALRLTPVRTKDKNRVR